VEDTNFYYDKANKEYKKFMIPRRIGLFVMLVSSLSGAWSLYEHNKGPELVTMTFNTYSDKISTSIPSIGIAIQLK
jgi:hypothetical protein